MVASFNSGNADRCLRCAAYLFVAGFIGSPSMNFLPCERQGNVLAIDGINGATHTMLALISEAQARFDNAPMGTPLVLGVRPEDIALVAVDSIGNVNAEVYVVELLGSENIINLKLSGAYR